MKISIYSNLARTLTPATGVGRHCNEVGLELLNIKGSSVDLLVSRKWLDPGNRLPENAPLRAINPVFFDQSDVVSERLRKLFGWSQFDNIIAPDTDWLYCPHDTRLSSKRFRTAITIHDPRMFEPSFSKLSIKQFLANQVMTQWLRRAALEATVVFTVSEFSRNRLSELLNLDRSKIFNIGNGVSKKFADNGSYSREFSESSSEKKTLVVVGGLRYLKGGDYIIQLAKALLAIGSPMEIVAIGGPDDPKMSATARTLPNIKQIGFVTDDELYRYLDNAFAMLNFSRYEGFGLPVIEAMSLGKPVIAHNATALPEVIGDAGFLVSDGNIEQVIELIEQLSSNSELYRSVQEKSRQHSKSYTWTNVAKRIFDVFNNYPQAEVRR